MLAGMSVGGASAAALQPQPPLHPQPGWQPVVHRQMSLGSVGVGGLLKREERRAAETEQ